MFIVDCPELPWKQCVMAILQQIHVIGSIWSIVLMMLLLATTATCVANFSTSWPSDQYLRLFLYIVILMVSFVNFVNIKGDFIHLRPLKDFWQ